MSQQLHTEIAIVGSGIVGLALAYRAASQGKKVTLFDRHPQALGASIRNFGLIWPIGQGPHTFERAMRSRAVWRELAQKAGVWLQENGCLHLAYHPDEWAVLEEFVETRREVGYQCSLLKAAAVQAQSQAVNPKGLIGGLWSSTEMTVDPRQALQAIPAYLQAQLGVEIHYQTAVTQVEAPYLQAGGLAWKADAIFVCSGADFETLFPEVFSQSGLTKCKLQMMRTAPQPAQWPLGPSLCAGLTLRHYDAFAHCEALKAVDARYDAENPLFKKWGIHVLLSQTALGELTIGDSHEYGLALTPFDKVEINQLILNYLGSFAQAPDLGIAESWHGIYAKIPGQTEFIASPQPGLTIVNGLSGAGMTLSFGLAEELL